MGTIIENKKKPKEYPFVMCKGDAMVPQRFWDYVIVRDLHTALACDRDGYVISNKSVNEIIKP